MVVLMVVLMASYEVERWVISKAYSWADQTDSYEERKLAVKLVYVQAELTAS